MKVTRLILSLFLVSQIGSLGCCLFHKHCGHCHHQRCTGAVPCCSGCTECGSGYGAPVAGVTMMGGPARFAADETLNAPQKAWPGPAPAAGPEKK